MGLQPTSVYRAVQDASFIIMSASIKLVHLDSLEILVIMNALLVTIHAKNAVEQLIVTAKLVTLLDSYSTTFA